MNGWVVAAVVYMLPGAAWAVHMLRHADEFGMSLWHRLAGVPVLLFGWPVMAVLVGVRVGQDLRRRWLRDAP